jgi:hypothetical protein
MDCAEGTSSETSASRDETRDMFVPELERLRGGGYTDPAPSNAPEEKGDEKGCMPPSALPFPPPLL